MKFLTLALLFVSTFAFAQIEKGTFLVSGNFSISKNNLASASIGNSPADVTQLQFTPYFGFMVSPRIAVGVLSTYSRYEQKYESGNVFNPQKTVLNTYSAGPFMRYYHPITERFFFFGQADVTFNKSEATYTLNDPSLDPIKATLSGTSVAIRPGISYFISKRWAIEVLLGSVAYNTRDYKTANQKTNMDGFVFSFITRELSSGVVFTF